MTRVRFVERGYAVVLLSCLTVAPVRWFWENRSTDADVSSAVSWTLLLVHLPALVLLGRRHAGRLAPVEWALVGLVGWLTLSVAWSAVANVSVVASTTLVLTCCAGVYLVRSFSWRELAALVFVAMQPGLVLSRVAIERSWPGSGDALNGFNGIYINRNLLGPPAVFAAACGVVVIVMLLTDVRRGPLARALWVGGACIVVLFDLDLQRLGGSMTSWFMLAAFLGVIAVLSLVVRRPAAALRPVGPLAVRLLLATFAVLFALAVVFNGPVSRALGRNPGFSRRTEYWAADLSGVLDRPFTGWGWMAAWRAEEFRATLPPSVAFDVFTHSTYFDIALGGGVVAVVMLLVLGYLGAGAAGSALDRTDVASAVPGALVVAIAVGSTEESFFMGNYFLTALLVAAFTVVVPARSIASARARPAVRAGAT